MQLQRLRQQLPPRHPQVRQREQRKYLRHVLGQAAIAHLGVTKLALQHSERVFDFGTHAGLALLPTSCVLLAALVLDRTQIGRLVGDQKCRLDVLQFRVILCASVATVAVDLFFAAMQQVLHLGHVTNVGGRAMRMVDVGGRRLICLYLVC